MTATPTRPAGTTGSIELPADRAVLRREVHLVQALVVVLAAAVGALEVVSDTTPGFFAVLALPFVLLGLITYGLALSPATRSWLPIAPVVLVAVAAGGVFATWQPWYWSAAYCAALVPAVGTATVARLRAN